MEPHLVRAQSAYKDIKIHSFHHTHMHTHTNTAEEKSCIDNSMLNLILVILTVML